MQILVLLVLILFLHEEDNSSPHKIFKDYNIIKKDVPNYDLDLAQMIAKTPTILGYQFEF